MQAQRECPVLGGVALVITLYMYGVRETPPCLGVHIQLKVIVNGDLCYVCVVVSSSMWSGALMQMYHVPLSQSCPHSLKCTMSLSLNLVPTLSNVPCPSLSILSPLSQRFHVPLSQYCPHSLKCTMSLSLNLVPTLSNVPCPSLSILSPLSLVPLVPTPSNVPCPSLSIVPCLLSLKCTMSLPLSNIPYSSLLLL